MWLLGIHSSNKFLQLFQVDVVRHPQTNSKQPVSYIYLNQFIHMGVVRHTWICQKKFPILDMQYVKTEMSFDVIQL